MILKFNGHKSRPEEEVEKKQIFFRINISNRSNKLNRQHTVTFKEARLRKMSYLTFYDFARESQAVRLPRINWFGFIVNICHGRGNIVFFGTIF